MSRNAIGTDIPIEVAKGGTGANNAAGGLADLGGVAIAGSTMTGALILNADPVLALGAATKQYADAIAAGFAIKGACVASSTANLNAIYNNGAGGVGATLTNNGVQVAFSTDSITPIVGDRILVPFQGTTQENGIYTLTDAGSGATNWVLTRATDYDQPAEIQAGSLVPVTSGTLYGQTSWIQTATVAVIGLDPIVFVQFTASPNTFAKVQLDNLSAVAINTTLVSDTDITDDLGSPSVRWNNLYTTAVRSGANPGDILNISAYDTFGTFYNQFIMMTAGNPPTCVLDGTITTTTQAPSDNSTKLATTAYVDASTATSANVALSNLAGVAINTALLPGLDNSIDLGSGILRFRNNYFETVRAGTTNGDQLLLQAYNVGGASYTTFATLTSDNATPTMSLASSVTGTTQAANNNSTKLATTAYTDNQVSTIAANKALSNLASVAINISLLPGADNSINLGDGTHRWKQIYSAGLSTGTTSGDTLVISARNVGGASDTAFFTLTADNATPTAVLGNGVTATTQIALDNSTKVATTAYVDSAVTAGSGANTALSNLVAVAINTSLISDTDVTDSLGSQAIRWNNVYTATVQTGDTAGDTLKIGAWDVDGAVFVPYITLTANNTTTCVLENGVTATTQIALDNSTKVATTAYVESAVSASGGANVHLSNLSAVAINASLIGDTDDTYNLGSATVRFHQTFATSLNTGTGAGNTTLLQAYNTNTAAFTTFATLTANNPPTMSLASAVTATTQSASDNSTKIATTAYADNQATTAASGKANVALDNLAGVAINTTLVSDTDVTDSLGTQAIRWNNVYAATLQTGDTATDTLQIGAWDVDGSSLTTFITLTANNTPTCALASDVTGVTQSASDNSTKLATTAYVDAAAGGGGSLTLIASVTASASATVNFDNKLSATYDNYLIVVEGFAPATNATTYECQIGTGGTPTYQTTGYVGTVITGNSSGGFAAVSAGTTFAGLSVASRTSNAAAQSGGGVLYINNVNSATNKTLVGKFYLLDSSGPTPSLINSASQWQSSTVLTSVKFLMSSGNINTGTYKLYGIKN